MIELRDALDLSPARLAADLTRCFEEYVVPIAFTPDMLCSMLRSDSVDLGLTRVAVGDGVVVGILLLCRRGSVSRVGAMAVAKPFRGQGVGKRLMDRTLEEAAERKDRGLVLEAIESNVGAVAFYEAAGFRGKHRLLGFSRKAVENPGSRPPNEIDFEEAASLLRRRPPDALSWSLSPATVALAVAPSRAFEFEGLGAVVVPVGEETLVIRSVARSGEDDGAKFGALLGGLGFEYPGRALKAPILFPEFEFRSLFLGAGFDQEPISQVEMERPLDLGEPP